MPPASAAGVLPALRAPAPLGAAGVDPRAADRAAPRPATRPCQRLHRPRPHAAHADDADMRLAKRPQPRLPIKPGNAPEPV